MTDQTSGEPGQNRGRNPALVGKNVERRRETDKWFYQFQIAGITYRGRCATHDKATAERIAKQIKGQKLAYAASEDFDTRLSALEDAVAAIRADIAALRKETTNG